MRCTKAGKICIRYKGIVWSILLLLFIAAFTAASADSLGTFSGHVWNDVDNNGLMDEADPGVAGVTMQLKRQDTGEVLTAVTDVNGDYLFTGLPNDSYQFSVALPDSMLLARYRSEGDERSYLTGDDTEVYRNIVIGATQDWTGINVGLVDSAIIRGITYLDVNYNGNYDEGEPPYAGVKLQMIYSYSEKTVQEIITGEDGVFYFNHVRTGNYRFRAIVPDDGSSFTLLPKTVGPFSNLFEPRPGRRENSVYEIDFENSMVYEYYIGIALGGQISGKVFYDNNDSGVLDDADSMIGSVVVHLIGTDGAIAAHASTNRRGEYTLTDVMPGTYTLRFMREDGYTFTKYRPFETGGNDVLLAVADTYGETEPFVVAMSEILTDYNAGMVQASTLGGVFFYDENDNGLMDHTESGFTEGSVRLVSDDGEIDLTQIVNADGAYRFSAVAPGTYTLYYLLPEHAELSKVVKDGNTLEHQGTENAVTGLVLESRKYIKQPLVGAVKLGTFEGYAFEDLNANSILDAGEAPLAGASVSVAPTDAPENAVTAVTDADGSFYLAGLRPDEYRLEIVLPGGMIFSGNILSSGIPLDRTDTYAAPVLFSTLLRHMENAVGAVAPASLRASVFLDENLNGVQDDAERKLDGLTYTLYDEIRRQTITTVQTGADGTAQFTNIRPSTYTVQFELPAYAQSVSGAGTMTETGGIMQQTGIEIHAGDSITGISGGLKCTTSIGGTILANRSGGREPVKDTEVHLYTEGDTELLQTTVSDAQGTYRFDGLWPGNYVIEVVRPDGYVFIRPNDPALSAEDSIIRQISDEYGTGNPIALYMAQDLLHNDVVLTIPAKVGSLAWLDENENGLMDGDEPMINGVTVSLMQDGAAIYTTTSNEWGYYEFSSVYPGEYILRAYAYPELDITTAIPAVQIISSCLSLGDGSIAVSDPFTVESESLNFFYHLGYVLKDGAEIPPGIIAGGAGQIWTRSNQP
ncbi:MAG: carboxypeptidase regulatory-like domain-containing protein [Clostridiales bacterium]|nr:carboxypeptidase regulatory-like domain-containing protein [Clostridiales bacterium]